MIRFMLGLAGALLVEEICERIRPAQWELAPPEGKAGRLTYNTVYVSSAGTTHTAAIADTLAYTDWPDWTPSRTGPSTVRFSAKDG